MFGVSFLKWFKLQVQILVSSLFPYIYFIKMILWNSYFFWPLIWWQRTPSYLLLSMQDRSCMHTNSCFKFSQLKHSEFRDKTPITPTSPLINPSKTSENLHEIPLSGRSVSTSTGGAMTGRVLLTPAQRSRNIKAYLHLPFKILASFLREIHLIQHAIFNIHMLTFVKPSQFHLCLPHFPLSPIPTLHFCPILTLLITYHNCSALHLSFSSIIHQYFFWKHMVVTALKYFTLTQLDSVKL